MDLPHGFTIVSGGQTGADRAALDFAIRFGIPHDGWCPRGRLAEDGSLDECYQLQETSSRKYDQRTRWNVRDSDATLVVSIQSQPTGGTALTLGVARQQGKPCLHIARENTTSVSEAGEQVAEFLLAHHVERLNIAGPRASQEPEIAAFVNDLLTAALASQVFTKIE
ncbi:MAG: putative molybdenum carrier protein [Bythopirellula sp.]|nr:putative molybdenum carrier protein [Bythopirellula sp.]